MLVYHIFNKTASKRGQNRPCRKGYRYQHRRRRRHPHYHNLFFKEKNDLTIQETAQEFKISVKVCVRYQCFNKKMFIEQVPRVPGR